MAITIKYNGATIASLDPGQKATLKCEEELMASDLVVEDESVGETDINGVLEYYRVNAGAKVSAGDFVEFVTKFQNGIFYEGAVTVRSACKLDDSRVLVAYSHYAVVITIKHDGIQVGEAVDLGSGSFYGAIALTDSKALFVREDDTCATAAVLIINGDEIRVGAEYEVYTYTNTKGIILSLSFTSLAQNKVLMSVECKYDDGNSVYSDWRYTVYLLALNISGENISAGVAVNVSTDNSYNKLGPRILRLADDKALVLTAYNKQLRSFVATVNQTTLTLSQAYDYTTASHGNSPINDMWACALTATKVLAVFQLGGISRLAVARIDISETTASYKYSIEIHDGYHSNLSIVAISENQALITYTRENYGRAMLIAALLNTVQCSEELTFDHYTVTSTALVALSETSALVAYNNATGAIANLTVDPDSKTITADSAETGTFVQPATSRLYNVGVARNSGEEGELVAVYRVE